MEELLESPVLKYPPNTLYHIRKMFNLEKPGRMKEAIDILEEWIKQQEHFESKNFDRNYLEILIIACKGSLEKAKMKIDKLCTMRTLAPEFFETELMEVKLHRTTCHFAVMPQLTTDYHKIMVSKALPGDLNSEDFLNILKDFILSGEHLLRVAYCLGYITILDFRSVNMKDLLVAINFTQASRSLTIIKEGYGVRIKSIHVLSDSKLIENFITLFKSIMPGKLAQRVYSHSTLESLHDMVPRELLCKELGGDEPPLEEFHNLRIKLVSSKEHIDYVKKVIKQRTDESKRIGGQIDADYLPGTFRSLNVD